MTNQTMMYDNIVYSGLGTDITLTTTTTTNPWIYADKQYTTTNSWISTDKHYEEILTRIEKIEERLAILRPNEELESKWEELKNLRQAYIELEKEILEKERIWNELKK